MRFLTLNEILQLHGAIIRQSGGDTGILNMNALESALAQPHMTFTGEELYPSLLEKAAVLGFSLIQNHPFVDGNKRVGHAAMEVFLMLNGCEIDATVDEQEQIILMVASGTLNREELTAWLEQHIIPID